MHWLDSVVNYYQEQVHVLTYE